MYTVIQAIVLTQSISAKCSRNLIYTKQMQLKSWKGLLVINMVTLKVVSLIFFCSLYSENAYHV